MDRKILYFINPVAGPKRKHAPEKIIADATRLKNISFEFALTNSTGYYPGLTDRVKDEGITDVVICGGDGSVNQIVSALLGVDVTFGIIPMGSGNGLALAAGIPAKTDKAIDLIFNGRSSWVDAFMINEKFSFMLCGLGFDAQVAHDFAAQPRRGLLTYIQQTIKNFINAKPYSFNLSIDGKAFNADAFFISIANGNQFGNNFKIAPKASLDDGLADVIVVKKMSKVMLLWSVMKHLLAGEVRHHEERNFHKKQVLYMQGKNILIQNQMNAPLHIDGEPVNTYDQIMIEVIPRAFRLIRN